MTIPTSDDQILEAILNREGRFSDATADRGRSTAWGISSRFHPEAWKNGPPAREIAKAIYAHDYLAPFEPVEPIALRAQVVDIAVNSGVSTARALLSLASAQTDRPVAVQLVAERLKHYGRIVQVDASQAVFFAGWVNRACEFL